MAEPKLDVLPGTLDLMVLRTLRPGPQHGYGIARRIEQIAGEGLLLNEGTMYASLVRLEQQGWISSEWGKSTQGRRAKFYSLTRKGHRQLDRETSDWQRAVAMMSRILESE